MEIKINNDGNLEIKRAGEWVKQECPKQVKCCGHHCPMFCEPEYRSPDHKSYNRKYLRLCGVMLIGTITDERGGK